MHQNAAPLTGGPVRHDLAVFELYQSENGFSAQTKASCTGHFDPMSYSKFKYGRRDLAEYYGGLLAEILEPHLANIGVDGESIVVTGTPYKRLPNAARMLAITAERLLRAADLVTSYTSIYQYRLSEGDYGKLNNAERDRRNQQKQRFFSAEDFEDKHVVIIDDVRITGSIERSITAMLSVVPTLSITVANLVKLDPQVALQQPELEDQLNHYSIQSLRDLLCLMEQRDRFTLTTRAVKYVLQSEPSELNWLLQYLDRTLVNELYEGIVDEGYDRMPCYYHAFELVCAARNQTTRQA